MSKRSTDNPIKKGGELAPVQNAASAAAPKKRVVLAVVISIFAAVVFGVVGVVAWFANSGSSTDVTVTAEQFAFTPQISTNGGSTWTDMSTTGYTFTLENASPSVKVRLNSSGKGHAAVRVTIFETYYYNTSTGVQVTAVPSVTPSYTVGSGWTEVPNSNGKCYTYEYTGTEDPILFINSVSLSDTVAGTTCALSILVEAVQPDRAGTFFPAETTGS